MSQVTLYVKGAKLVTSSGNPLAPEARPVVRWREQVSFRIVPVDCSLAEGSYHYAFDHDRDFLRSLPWARGECPLDSGALAFTTTFNSRRQADVTSGRRFPIPLFIQITRDGSDHAEYILDDTLLADGCVWDGHAAPSEPASAYYTADQINALVDATLNTAEASAIAAESYARGGTSTRPGENTDNASYYSRQAAASAYLSDAAKVDAVMAKNDAVSAKIDAVSAKTDAAQAKTDAQMAKTGAENALASIQGYIALAVALDEALRNYDGDNTEY